jgi:hypothetical protein
LGRLTFVWPFAKEVPIGVREEAKSSANEEEQIDVGVQGTLLGHMKSDQLDQGNPILGLIKHRMSTSL